MQINRKIIILAAITAVVITAVAFTAPTPPENGYKNLKILPKDISKEKLDKIMFGFKDALGVKCNFCHAPSKDTAVHHPDFASDDKPEKSVARFMMKMTVKINKKFFEARHAYIGDTVSTVTCVTCHHGEPHPEAPEPKADEHGPALNPPPPGEKQ